MRVDDAQTTWRHEAQAYYVAQWSTTKFGLGMEIQQQGDGPTVGRMINCFLRGNKPEACKRKLAALEDDESDEEEEQLVCTMTGQNWESLPFPVIIDSGACASVMPSVCGSVCELDVAIFCRRALVSLCGVV